MSDSIAKQENEEQDIAKDLSDMRRTMNEKGVMFCFSGFMTEAVLTGIAGALRQKLVVEEADTRTAKGLFSIFVELVQNVIRYSAEREEIETPEHMIDLRYGVITVGRVDEHFYVACGNMIANKDVPRMSADLDQIKGLDRAGLKALYKQTLKNPTPETSKGAGVGFIEIARQAPEGFKYSIRQIDDQHSFFAVQASI